MKKLVSAIIFVASITAAQAQEETGYLKPLSVFLKINSAMKKKFSKLR